MDLCNINDIKFLLGQNGFRFSKSMGQNFLTASWVPEKIADMAGIQGRGVLEVGPGIGALTVFLAKSAKKVVSVEVDKSLLPLLETSLAGIDNAEVVSGDILKLDIPQLVSEKFDGLTPAACANLPYNITTPVLTALIEAKCFESITVTVQREVARRICAGAGSADYGAFSVFVQYHTEPEILFDVAPSCFIPQPKVYSSVIRLTPRSGPPCCVNDEKLFFRTVRASFAQRRKTLVNGLSSGFPELTKEEISDIIVSCGYGEKLRGETLDIPGFARISDAIGKAICG